MPASGLFISRSLTIFSLILLASLCAVSSGAADPIPSKYPLRLHVLTIDDRHEVSQVTSGGMGSVCDDSLLNSATITGFGDDEGPISVGDGSSDLCDLGSRSMVFSQTADYAGAGRADLVAPPNSTRGIGFTFDSCGWLRVPAGFHGLPARWKKPGKQLEVLVPSNALPVKGHTPKPEKCTLGVVEYDFVYLLLRNGSMVAVAQDGFWKKPALRIFLSGNARTLQERVGDQSTPASPTH